MTPYTLLYKLFRSGIFGPDLQPEDGGEVSGNDVVTVSPGSGSDGDVVVGGHEPRYLWCIDAGHDEAQAGKRSPRLPAPVTIYGKTYPVYREYIGNRDIAERLIELLSAAGVAYMRTLPYGTRIGNGLKERVANANGYVTDLPRRGLSIHSNAGPTTNPSGWDYNFRGIETWFYNGSELSEYLAGIFQIRVMKAANRYTTRRGLESIQNRGLKFSLGSAFYILRKTTMPFALVEILFMTNRDEVKVLSDPDFRQMIAEALFDSIMEVETAPRVQSLTDGPDDLRAWLTMLSFLATIFIRDPKERAANKRRRYIKRLQKREAKGKITTVQYERYLADYDRQNPKP